MKKIVFLIAVVIAGICAFCLMFREKKNMNVIGKPDVTIAINENDSEMNDAIAMAKKTFPKFLENWKTAKNQGYSLKFAVSTSNGGVEHIWFNPVSINGDVIQAVCASDPKNVPGLKDGDIRELKKSDISDWMIMLNGKCYGGYTTRVLGKRDPSQKPPFDFADF